MAQGMAYSVHFISKLCSVLSYKGLLRIEMTYHFSDLSPCETPSSQEKETKVGFMLLSLRQLEALSSKSLQLESQFLLGITVPRELLAHTGH